MILLHSFPPAVAPGARVLLLGSLPGAASLAAGEYYAHPRNAFWPLMQDLFGIHRDWPYARRIEALTASGVALWDVVASARRPGSLDADIVPDSVIANDFSALFTVHREIRHIFFNGAAAEALFRRHVRPLPDWPPAQRLPSSSPAHAALSYAQKLAAWQAVREALQAA